jgi:hypothetical protein
MAKKQGKGFKAPTSKEDAYAMAQQYQRGIANADRELENFYRREAGRVPTVKELEKQIGEYYAPAYAGIPTAASNVSGAAANINAMLGGLSPMATEDAAANMGGLVNLQNQNVADLMASLAVERSNSMLAARQSADTKRSAAREGAASSRANRRKTMADWLSTFSSFNSLIPTGGSSGGGGSTNPASSTPTAEASAGTARGQGIGVPGQPGYIPAIREIVNARQQNPSLPWFAQYGVKP